MTFKGQYIDWTQKGLFKVKARLNKSDFCFDATQILREITGTDLRSI